MPYKNQRSSYTSFILIFVFIKVALNLLAIANFGFHRDELLHLALGDHLDWGYKEVPPFIAVIAWFGKILFGPSLFAARVFSTICSGLIIWLTGKIVVELGGKKFAIALACLALIFSPAFLASGYLFQPVVFDQLWWVLTAWLLLRYINTQAIKYLYFIGVTIGFGVLTKYTMLFFAVALLTGLAISKQRRLLLSKHMWGAALVTILIILPNIIWQFTHHWPVFNHMAELKEKQLDYVKPIAFIAQQFMVHGAAMFVWVVGFLFLVFSFKLRKYQSLAVGYVLIFIFLLLMNGKNYYLFGAYPMLFAAGGYGFERWIKSSDTMRGAAIAVFTLPNLIFLPLVLPVLPLKPTLAVFEYVNSNVKPLSFLTRWQDRKQHPITQDYADMFGWEEATAKVARAYHKLSPQQQKETIIFADNYGFGGALHHFGEKHDIPDPVCLNSSFSLWAPDSLNARYIIFVNNKHDWDAQERFRSVVWRVTQLDTISAPYAVEKGSVILLLEHPSPAFYEGYKKRVVELKAK